MRTFPGQSVPLLLSILAVMNIVAGCIQNSEPPDPATPAARTGVAVTSQPLLEMAQTVVQDALPVFRIIPDGVSSPAWKPGKDDVRKLREADLVFINGAGYEPWTDRISLPTSRLKDTASSYYDDLIRIPDAVTHQHGPSGKHAHPGTVWATWLDPRLADAQLTQITKSIVQLLPDRKAQAESAAAKLKSQFDLLNQSIEDLAASTRDLNLVVMADGPFYQYLTGRLGWKLQYMHCSDEESLTQPDRDELQRQLKDSSPTPPVLFLLSTRRSEQHAEFITSLGLTVVRIDLCEFSLPAVSMVDRLKGNLERLKAATHVLSR